MSGSLVILVDRERAERAESAETPDWRSSLRLRVSAVPHSLPDLPENGI